MTPEEICEAHRRDLKSVREDIVEAQEEAARQTLIAFQRTTLAIEAQAGRTTALEGVVADLVREVRESDKAAKERDRTLRDLLHRAVEIPAAPSRFSRFVEWVGAALALRPAAARLLVAVTLTATFVSGLSALLSACTVAGAMRAQQHIADDARVPTGGLYP